MTTYLEYMVGGHAELPPDVWDVAIAAIARITST